ncbi:universal stress protein [Glutamicibacter sp.]|uniref:universal stress protein n=1 Tax=Glutamicibacter sp. TaxID=1931995 RepID=UPI0028BD6C8A|nr:universal stress protein [Glutamicibacter sp.]
MGTIVVGIEPGQPRSVLVTAASFAKDLNAAVQVIYADSGRFVTERLPEQNVLGTSEATFPQELADLVESTLGGVAYELHNVPGDPAKVLAAVAKEVDASMIVIGTRRPGLRSKLAEFIDGSIAVALAHKQSCPLLVVPQQIINLPGE